MRPVSPACPVLLVFLAGLAYDACHMGDTLWCSVFFVHISMFEIKHPLI